MLKHLVFLHKVMGEIGEERDKLRKNKRAVIRMNM